MPKANIANSGQLVAALFFKSVFGDHAAVKVLLVLIARKSPFPTYILSLPRIDLITFVNIVSALVNIYAVRVSSCPYPFDEGHSHFSLSFRHPRALDRHRTSSRSS